MMLLAVTVVLTAGCLAQLLARRLPPATRHAMAAITLGVALLLPWLRSLTPLPLHQFVTGTRLLAATTRAVPSIQWWPILAAAGAGIVLLRALLGYLYLHRQTRRATAWPNVAGDVRLAPVATPLVWGLFRPTILLPLDAPTWPRAKLRTVLLHEQAHISRGDLLMSLLSLAVQAAYWYHPLTWWLTARLRADQELACDEFVLAAGIAPADYADLLLEAARRQPSPALFGCAMISQPDHLKGRIMHILHLTGRPRASRWVRAFPAVFALLLLGLATVSAQQAPYRIGGDVKPPKLTYKVEPEYTNGAREAKIEGRVTLSIVVSDKGEPAEVSILHGLDTGLDRNAVTAVRQWLFTPGTKEGVPVPVVATVEVNFKLK